MIKRTFSFSDEKEEVYERFKGMVPEVSSGIMDMIEGYVKKQEALSSNMAEKRVFKGKHDLTTDIFSGQEFRFWGVKIAEGEDEYGEKRKVYLTKKGKFLVFGQRLVDGVDHMGFTVYDNYEELAAKLPNGLLEQCQEYLGLNSHIRTYIELDI